MRLQAICVSAFCLTAGAALSLISCPLAARAQTLPGLTFTSLYSFGGPGDGGDTPNAGLVQGADGNFYGTTYGGDTDSDLGAVYKITPSGAETILHTFTGGADGRYPVTPLTLGSDGNLYGTTSGQDYDSIYGTIFQITPTGTLTTLYTFTGAADGEFAAGALVLGTDGNFYGAAAGNGHEYDGSVFKMALSGAFTILHTFDITDGINSPSSLVEGSNGSFMARR